MLCIAQEMVNPRIRYMVSVHVYNKMRIKVVTCEQPVSRAEVQYTTSTRLTTPQNKQYKVGALLCRYIVDSTSSVVALRLDV